MVLHFTLLSVLVNFVSLYLHFSLAFGIDAFMLVSVLSVILSTTRSYHITWLYVDYGGSYDFSACVAQQFP